MEGKNKTVAVIGLGYVGLPLAVEFGKRYTTIGYDINRERIEELQKGEDRTLEVSREELQSASALTLTNDLSPVGEAQIFIITVPTPVDQSKSPDLTPLIGASDMIGRLLKKVILSYMNLPYIPDVRKKFVCRYWNMPAG